MQPPIRIIAWGNRGRRDDGVALALAEQLEIAYDTNPNVIVQQYHQLGPEIVEDLNDCALALFLDAHALDDASDVVVTHLSSDRSLGLDTHHCRPEQLLALSESLGLVPPPAVQIGIKAYDMNFGDTLSAQTQAAMDEAERIIVKHIEDVLTCSPHQVSSESRA